jgi:hypothetical protein
MTGDHGVGAYILHFVVVIVSQYRKRKSSWYRAVLNGKKERKGGPGMTWFIDCIG